MQQQRLVILDRDGVINEDSAAFVRSLEAWRPIVGSIDAISRLSRSGWNVAVATNQSGIARGVVPRAEVEAMHARLRELVHAQGGEVAHIAVCPHGPNDGCACRKPATGLIAQIESVMGRSAVGAPFVGDSLRDVQAAIAHGCVPVLVRTGHGAEVEAEARSLGVREVFADLAAVADWLSERWT